MNQRAWLSTYLDKVEYLMRHHLPVYFDKWDKLSTAVCWLLRRQRGRFFKNGQASFWQNVDKNKPLRVPYDFVRPDYEYLDRYSPMELPQKAKDFIKTFLGNVGTIVNVKFYKADLPEPNRGDPHRPQLRFGFSKLKLNNAEAYQPGHMLSGGDIWLGTKSGTSDFPEEKYKSLLVHETSHALGLAHTHSDFENGESYMVGGEKIEYHGIGGHFMGMEEGDTPPYKYDNKLNSVMSYKGKNPIEDHLGIFDYMALIAVYGPNPNNQHVKDIVASYRSGRIQKEDFTPKNFRKISRSLPSIRGSDPGKHHVYSTHQAIPGPKRKLWRGRQHFVEGPSVSVNFSVFKHRNTLYNGFNHEVQSRRGDLARKGISFSQDTMISFLVGTRNEDVFICSKQLQRAQGHKGNDIYVLHGNDWGPITIDDTKGSDKNEISFIIFYDVNIDYLLYKYEGLHDLIVYNSRNPQQFVRIKDYFKKPKLFFIGFLNSYKEHYRYTRIKNYPDFIAEVRNRQARSQSTGKIHLVEYKNKNVPHFDHRKVTTAQAARRRGSVTELLCVQGINGDQCPASEILSL